MAAAQPPQFREPIVQGSDGRLRLDQAWLDWFTGLPANEAVVALEAAVAAISTQMADIEADVASIQGELAAGFDGTVALAKLTGGGVDGSLTVVNGLITAYAAPT